ncbi:TolC family protein [Collimonas fungivorans]|uniref:Protein CyaE n=1 Tax=Collimonas fungivorans (strain Ter331) TaxID=1005048 RepID=G0AH90_COLFT|nr:TolC family protein [Collimonas fungivorans]AEK62496.1 outer membrane efflux protein [Collimonas fungivorans Ter331]
MTLPNQFMHVTNMWKFSGRVMYKAILLVVCWCGVAPCFGIDLGLRDPLRQLDAVPVMPAGQMFDGSPSIAICTDNAKTELTLLDVVSAALCHNPKTREAWVNVKVQAAQVGLSKAAYLPTLTGTGQAAKDRSTNHGTPSAPFYVQSDSSYQNAALTLNWVLYDFGARSANVSYAKSLLASALAGQDSTLQAVFANTVKDYYAALVAQKNAQSTQDIEADTQRVFDAAVIRVRHGVAAISDQLQAQTAYSQAKFNRSKAEGDWQSALGQLAIDIGQKPNAGIHLAETNTPVLPDTAFVRSVVELLQSAQERHPSLVAARADLAAAQANEKMIRAQGRPTISFVGKYNYNNQPQSSGAGQQYYGETSRDRSIGIQINIPFFEGFTRTYQIRGAQAQIEGKEASLTDAELQVASGVWTSYQTLRVDTDNLRTSQEILDSAKAAFEAAQARYTKGVTGILELITTQTALANAQQQRIAALAGWQNAKIQLAASIGTLNLSVLH